MATNGEPNNALCVNSSDSVMPHVIYTQPMTSAMTYTHKPAANSLSLHTHSHIHTSDLHTRARTHARPPAHHSLLHSHVRELQHHQARGLHHCLLRLLWQRGLSPCLRRTRLQADLPGKSMSVCLGNTCRDDYQPSTSSPTHRPGLACPSCLPHLGRCVHLSNAFISRIAFVTFFLSHGELRTSTFPWSQTVLAVTRS